MKFKDFIENLWGEIPVVGRKPSDGPPNPPSNPNSPGSAGANGAGGGDPMGAQPAPTIKMMKKKMRKN